MIIYCSSNPVRKHIFCELNKNKSHEAILKVFLYSQYLTMQDKVVKNVWLKIP